MCDGVYVVAHLSLSLTLSFPLSLFVNTPVSLGLSQGVTVDQGLRLLSLLRSKVAPTNKSVEKFVAIFSVRAPSH
jgi:hypothetical protein